MLPEKRIAFVGFQNVTSSARVIDAKPPIPGCSRLTYNWGKEIVAPGKNYFVPTRKLHVSNYPNGFDQAAFEELFKSVFKDAILKFSPDKKYCFVEFSSLENAIAGKMLYNGKPFEGKPLRINYSSVFYFIPPFF